MNRFHVLFCATGILLLLSGCSQAPAPPAAPDTAADEKAIRDGETAWNQDWASKDVEKIASHYADDANLMIPGLPIAKGKEAIRATLKTVVSDSNLALNFGPTTVEVSKGGDLAYSQGTYSMTTTDAKTKKAVTEKGKYATIYKKQADGAWKAIQDINNADGPAQ